MLLVNPFVFAAPAATRTNRLANPGLDNGGAGWTNNNPNALSFSGGQAVINDQFGDQSANISLLFQTGVLATNTLYDIEIDIGSYTRGALNLRMGATTKAVGRAQVGLWTINNINSGSAGPSERFDLTVAPNTIMSINSVALYLH